MNKSKSQDPQTKRRTETQKPVMVWLQNEEYTSLKRVLGLQGKTMTGWFRAMARKEVEAYDTKNKPTKGN